MVHAVQPRAPADLPGGAVVDLRPKEGVELVEGVEALAVLPGEMKRSVMSCPVGWSVG
jgi:hypothetical protein